MARTDAIVLGAGIVGTSIALQLARSGLSVSLVDRRPPGEETSYGNAGIIEGNTVFPPAFPSSPAALLRIALKLAPEANYHLRFLPRVAPWLLAFRAASRPPRLAETARLMRPLFADAIAEHETLLREAGATRFLRTNGWLKLYRSEAVVAGLGHELDFASELGIEHQRLDVDATLALEPALAPTFRQSVFWPSVASLSDPLAVTRAYAARFARLRRPAGARATPARCTRSGRAGASKPRRGRSMPARSWWRSGRSHPICSTGLASDCRSGSSAAITVTIARRVPRD